MAFCFVAFAAVESEYATGVDGTAVVNFGPDPFGAVTVKSIYAKHANNGSLKFYAKGGAGRVAQTAMAGTTVTVANVAYAISTSDLVIYYDTSADAVYYQTVASSTLSNIVLSSEVNVTWASGDQVYELTQQGQIDLISEVNVPLIDPATNVVVGTATNNVVTALATDNIFVTPTDSPLRVTIDTSGGSTSSSNVTLQVTADR